MADGTVEGIFRMVEMWDNRDKYTIDRNNKDGNFIQLKEQKTNIMKIRDTTHRKGVIMNLEHFILQVYDESRKYDNISTSELDILESQVWGLIQSPGIVVDCCTYNKKDGEWYIQLEDDITPSTIANKFSLHLQKGGDCIDFAYDLMGQ